MANADRTWSSIERCLETVVALGAVGQQTDADLLDQFVAGSRHPATTHRAELAFEALVDRHGGTVLRVARTILGDEAASLDASQATFLVLARKARSLRVEQSLAPWLAAVARRVALGARKAQARRQRHERTAARPEAIDDNASDSSVWSETLRAVLTEVDRLPEPFRAAVVACHLDGLTQQTAADRLGWPIGTLQSRLDRGRRQLRDRLTRRGLAPSALGLIPPAGLAITLPPSLTTPLARAATLCVTRSWVSSGSPLLFTATRGSIMFRLSATALAAATVLGLAVTTTRTTLDSHAQAAGDVVSDPTTVPDTPSFPPKGPSAGADSISPPLIVLQPSQLKGDLIGAWVLAGTPDKPADPPKSGGRIKFFTGQNWCITQAEPETGKVTFHHGGTYTLAGDELRTTIEYAIERSADSIKQTRRFKIKVDQDTYTQIGIDNPYNEVWRRIKTPVAESAYVPPVEPPVLSVEANATEAVEEPSLSIPTAYPRPWDTTVRIRTLVSNQEWGFASGTVIASTTDESIILTVASLFRDKQGLYPSGGRFTIPIRIDLFNGQLSQTKPAQLKCIQRDVEGEVIAIHRDHDYALIRIRPGRVLPASPIAAGGKLATKGEDLISVGCSHGNDATAWDTKVLQPRVEMSSGSRKFFVIKCSNQSAEGRSGGGLFTRTGYLVGICQFADPNEHTGLYTETAAFEELNKCIDRDGEVAKFDLNILKNVLPLDALMGPLLASPASLASGAESSVPPEPRLLPAVSDRQRLSDLERKLDRVLESLDNIRGEVGSKRPAGILPP